MSLAITATWERHSSVGLLSKGSEYYVSSIQAQKPCGERDFEPKLSICTAIPSAHFRLKTGGENPLMLSLYGVVLAQNEHNLFFVDFSHFFFFESVILLSYLYSLIFLSVAVTASQLCW